MKNYKVDKDAIIAALENRNNRSAWTRGVNVYAIDLVENLGDLESGTVEDIKKALLNGATDWSQYSWSGSALICDSDIALTLCTPSELKKKKGGELRPNQNEDWLDVQARALFQAENRVKRTIINLNR